MKNYLLEVNVNLERCFKNDAVTYLKIARYVQRVGVLWLNTLLSQLMKVTYGLCSTYQALQT